MVEHYGALPTPDLKRRKLDPETMSGHVKAERPKGIVTDKAKANYLSGQLRLRLQYAKLKVEHGWQRQSLSEVENLYFRHTHLTRPYPVISPGGRRNGRILSSHSFSTQQENIPLPTAAHRDYPSYPSATQAHTSAVASTSSSQRLNGALSGASSYSSVDYSATPSVPSTPVPDTTRIATPLAPHVGFGTATRYPISRSDSSATLIIESTPSLYPASPTKPHPSISSSSSSSQPNAQFREPFDPMEPTEHLDSQLAALRSIMSASALPIALPPRSPALPMRSSPVSGAVPGAPAGLGSGLTYDAFWTAHGSATASFRSMLAGHGPQPAGDGGTPLHAHASAPTRSSEAFYDQR